MPDHFKTNDINSAVVTPLDEHMGLDIARSLGRRGIPVFGFDPDPQVAGRASKYCKLVVCPDPKNSEQNFIQFLVDWGKHQRNKPVLFPVSDKTALLCSRDRHILESYFEFVMPDHQTMNRMSSKEGLALAAVEFDIPVPKTINPRNFQDVQMVANGLDYPVILKPVESEFWHAPEIVQLLRKNALSGRVKVMVCQDAQELEQVYGSIAAYDDRMIIQELIPGPDENLAYICFYLDRQSQPLAIFAGRKLRVLPTGFGSASFVRSAYDPELVELALRLLSSVRYQGVGGIEFKKDFRDNCYKLIEFNTRFGMWDGLSVRCGVDIAYIAYQDAIRKTVKPQLIYRNDVIWVDWQRDLRAFWGYHKSGLLSLGQWLRSLEGEKMWAVFSRDDWRPGIIYSLNLLRQLWVRYTNKISLPGINRQ
jgi:D-aspartate ligase